MNKQEFQKANEEIKAGEELKRKTFQIVTQRKKSNNVYLVGKVAAVMAVVLLLFNVFYLKEKEQEPQQAPITVAQIPLEKLESFDKLKEIARKVPGFNQQKSTEGLTNDVKESVADSKRYSETNHQVAGVQESDTVKTDGEYIYTLSDNKVVIVDARNPKELKMVKEIAQKEENYYAMYLEGNQMIVLSFLMESSVNRHSSRKTSNLLYS